MNVHNQGFSGGLNQDLSNNKYPNNCVYWASNFRLVSKDGLSTGALTNINGNNKILSLGGDGEQVKGYCLIRDTLVLFIHSDDGGRIMAWEHTNTDYETESPKLIYTDPNLDFSQADEIIAVGRYETENIQKVYFTDGVSFFKHLNIVHPTLGLGAQLDYDIDSLDLVSDVEFSSMSLELVSGGNLKAGKIQYAYQLYSKRGSESVLSPASQLIHLTEYDEKKDSRDYFGSEINTNVNKSVLVTIENPDELFTRLRLVALEYSVLYQVPSIRIVGEYNIENLSSITVVDTGSSIGELTLEEYRFIQNNFYPKTLDIKNDYLFAANIQNDYFDITDEDFDARVFRANSSDVITVYNGNSLVNIPYPFASETMPAFDKELYNKFNDINNDYVGNTASGTQEFKYQPGSSGTILGGKGVNIEYEFVTDQVVLDDTPRSNDWGEGYPRLQVNSKALFENQANPLTKVGYQRDEIYRFGIVFFDKKGRQSFAKWIGDIRFPTNRELPFIQYDSVNNRTLANILGIKFTVNTSNINDKISGYQIVRSERTSADKTILSQGLVGYPIYTSIGEAGDANHLYSLATEPLVRDMYYKYTSYDRHAETIGNISADDLYERNNSNVSMNDTYLEFDSPDIVINKPKLPITGAYMDVFGYLTNVENCTISGVRGYEDNDHGFLKQRDILTADKPRGFGYGNSLYRTKVDVSNYRLFSAKSVGLGGSADDDATKLIIDGGQIYNNQAYSPQPDNSNSKSKWGLRGTHALLNIEDPIAIDTNWLSSSDNIRFLIANYRVFKGRSIYGGSSYEARTYSKYYPASEFIEASTSEVDVYGGDTYISYFIFNRAIYDQETRTEGYRIESYQMYPVESTINLNLRLDKMQDYINWGFFRDSGVVDYKLMEDVRMGVSIYGSNYPSELGNLYRYNSVYSAIDKSKEYYSKPFDFDSEEINDTRIYASEKKINGEYIDQWTKFKFNNYIDVDSKHDAITKIVTFKNYLFCVQPTGISIVSVNPRSVINDNNAGELVLGTGGILDRYDYITEKSGSTFYDGIITSDDYLFYVDGKRKRINKIVPGKEEAISVIKGIDSTLDKLTFETVNAGFDRGYNEVIFAIDGITVAFNEAANCFSGSYSFIPGKMISIGGDFYSTFPFNEDATWLYSDFATDTIGYSGTNDTDPDWDNVLIGPSGQGEGLWKHNIGNPGQFYGGDGGAEDSYITLIINPNQNMVCYFDNLDLRTESTDSNGDDVPDDIFYRMEVSNSYQEITKELTFNLNQNQNTGSIKRLGRIWRTSILPQVASGNSASRIVDTYIKLTLRYDNSSGNKFKVHDAQVYWRPAKH